MRVGVVARLMLDNCLVCRATTFIGDEVATRCPSRVETMFPMVDRVNGQASALEVDRLPTVWTRENGDPLWHGNLVTICHFGLGSVDMSLKRDRLGRLFSKIKRSLKRRMCKLLLYSKEPQLDDEVRDYDPLPCYRVGSGHVP